MLTPSSRRPALVGLALLVVILQATPASTAGLFPAPPGPLGGAIDPVSRALADAANDASRAPAEGALDVAGVALQAHMSRTDLAPELAGMVAQQERNLATTRALLAGLPSHVGGDGLDAALWAANEAGSWQLAALGASHERLAVEASAYATLSGAVRGIAARQDAGGALDGAALARLDALPPELQIPLRDTLVAFLAFYDATAAGFETASIDTLPMETVRFDVRPDGALDGDGLPLLSRAKLAVVLGPAIAARQDFLGTLPALRAALVGTPPAPHGACAPIVIAPVLALDTEGCISIYSENVALSIDAGGDDVYQNNAGGFPGTPCSFTVPSGAGASALVDLDGNDRYVDAPGAVGTIPGVLCGTNGGGFYGAGLLVDLEGDDVYERIGLVANGAGNRGLGLVIDTAGSNRYVATDMANGGAISGVGALLDLAEAPSVYIGNEVSATGGACYGGYGFLVDTGGSDHYRSVGGCGSNGQGGGAAPSVGFLFDAGVGNDLYEGRNGGGAISAGFLFDEGGNDIYVGPLTGVSQGGSSNGVGMMIDAAGNDRLYGGHLGGNGGALGGLAHLIDMDGDDLYVAGSLATNGGASDEGHGLLFDARGNDRYEAGGIATNGGGFFGGNGFLLDLDGDDIYVALGNGVNGGGSTVFPGTGRLVDARGRDVYVDDDGGAGTDVTVVPKGTVGAQLDLEVTL